MGSRLPLQDVGWSGKSGRKADGCRLKRMGDRDKELTLSLFWCESRDGEREEKGAEEDLKNGDGERYIFRKNARQLQAETV